MALSADHLHLTGMAPGGVEDVSRRGDGSDMAPTSPRARRISRFVIVAVLIWSFWPLLIAPFNWGKCQDDMYITFTYARSLANGDGFVYNHPPATLGTTAPLLTFALAFFARLLRADLIPQIAVVLTALCWSAAVWLIYVFRSAFGLRGWQAAVLGAAILAGGNPEFLGFENYLFWAIMIASVGFAYSRRPLPAGVLAGLLFLTRGEGVLLLPLLLLAAVFMHRNEAKLLSEESLRAAAWMSGGFLAVLGAWSIYALPVFGGILPNTLAAKLAQQEAGLFGIWARALFVEYMPQWERQFLPQGWSAALNIWWIVTLFGIGYVIYKHRRWIIFFAWLVLFVAGYAVLGVPNYTHYQEIARFVFLLGTGFGLAGLIELSLKVSLKFRGKALAAAACFSCLFLALMFAPRAEAAFNRLGDTRHGPTRVVGEWFRANASPEETVAYVEIGFLAYYSGNRILDIVGLTDPEGVEHIRQGDFAWAFFQHMPEFYMHMDNFNPILEDIEGNSEFSENYRVVARFPSNFPSDFVIYARQDVARRFL